MKGDPGRLDAGVDTEELVTEDMDDRREPTTEPVTEPLSSYHSAGSGSTTIRKQLVRTLVSISIFKQGG